MDKLPSIFFDLQKKLMDDTQFMTEMMSLQSQILAASTSHNLPLLQTSLGKLLRTCDMNPSLLLRYFFPNFSDNQPMTLYSRPHAFAMMAHIPNGSLTIAASRQVGKCVTGETEVMVKVGDEAPKAMNCKDLFSMARKKIACAGAGE